MSIYFRIFQRFSVICSKIFNDFLTFQAPGDGLLPSRSSNNMFQQFVVQGDVIGSQMNAQVQSAIIQGTPISRAQDQIKGPVYLSGLGSSISGSEGMLSKKGRCFTFDHSADGYARGEGIGGFVLKCLHQSHTG